MPKTLALLRRVNNRQTLSDRIARERASGFIDNLGTLARLVFDDYKFFRENFPKYKEEESLYSIPLNDSIVKEILDFIEQEELKGNNCLELTNAYYFKEIINGQEVNLSYIEPKAETKGVEARIGHTDPTGFPLIHTKLESLQNEILIERDTNQTINKLAEFYWWMSQACFFERGSASIADWYLDALAKTKGINIIGWKDGIDPNLEAILTPKEEFISNFPNLGEIKINSNSEAQRNGYPNIQLADISSEFEEISSEELLSVHQDILQAQTSVDDRSKKSKTDLQRFDLIADIAARAEEKSFLEYFSTIMDTSPELITQIIQDVYSFLL